MNAYINQLDNILFVKKIQNPVGPSIWPCRSLADGGLWRYL